MKICILGAGVIGLTTAWELVERGHEVAIVDRQREPGRETSFANAGQLAYTYVAPLASPETLRKLPALILDPAAPIRVRPSLDVAFLRWCAGFLAACSTRAFTATVVAQLALAALSRDVLDELASSQGLAFGRRTAGKLLLYRSSDGFADASKRVWEGQQVLSGAECVALEPALKLRFREIAGGIFTAAEQVGDCHAFCRELAARLGRRNAVTWHLGRRVERAVVRDGALQAVATDGGDLTADLFVLALGADSLHFGRSAGVRLPIYPMKGFSITACPAAGAPMLAHSVTDYDRKMAYAPLADVNGDSGGVVRVTGGADLVGFDRRVEARRIATLTRHAEAMLALDLTGDLQPWAGLRPATPDGRPIIGWSPLRNLFLNLGQGAFGWTLACGSARLAAELIDRAPPSVRPEWFALRRAA